MTQWLLERLVEHDDHPNPRFAFQGSVNWIRAAALICAENSWDHATLHREQGLIGRRSVNVQADTACTSSMLMALHYQATLDTLHLLPNFAYNVCRLAIVAWYYSIYFSASAMLEACTGQAFETHADTARVWGHTFGSTSVIRKLFDLTLSGIVPASVDRQISNIRGSNSFDLNLEPQTAEQATGALISYLKGTAKFEQWKIEEKIRSSREFRALGVSDFRTRAARELRDARLAQKEINFLVQSFRYRGKANYRDSIFLSYGPDNTARITQFVTDLRDVSKCFQAMAASYISRRVERGTWDAFVTDLDQNLRLNVDYAHFQA